ncbi:MAG: (Fe-S)-binding protein [Candidatus Helarchaeota archaeon]
MTQPFSEFIKKYVETCQQCGKCFEDCFAYKNTKYPIFKYLKDFFKSHSHRKKIQKFLKSCIYCKKCNSACINRLDLTLLIPAIKYHLYEINPSYTWSPYKVPSQITKTVRSPRFYYFLRNLNNYLVPKSSRRRFKEHREPKKRDVVFYSGCGVQLLENQFYIILEILKKLGIDFGLIEGLYDAPVCCGAIHFEVGNFEYGQYLLQNLINQVKKFETKKVIVYCATCYYGLKKLAPNLIHDYDLEIIHASSYIADILKSKSNKIPNTSKRNEQIFTIHDSCHLAHSGEAEGIRALLSILPGANISEMKHNKQNAICDASALLTSLNNPLNLFFKNINLPIIQEAIDSEADVLCTLCPGCHAVQTIAGFDILTILGKKKPKISVKNWVTILGEYLGIRKRDMLIHRFSHIVSFPFKESGTWYLWQVLKALIYGYFGKREPKI